MVQIALLIFISFFIASPSEALAQGYPDRPIQIVVPYGAGGPVDLAARLVGDQLGKELKTPVAILNKIGGGGGIGASFVAQAKKDGYTLLLTSSATYMTAILQPKDVNFDMDRDFDPIGKITELASLVVVRGDAPWKTLAELLNDVKKNPKKYSFGTAPIGTTPYFIWAVMNTLGFETNNVITATSPEDIALLKGGHINIMSEALASLGPYLRDKSFRALAISTQERVKSFPDIPTIPEAGYPEMSNYPQFTGLFAPAGTPQPIQDTLSSALQRAMKDPGLQDRLDKMSFISSYQGPAEFKQMLRVSIPRIRTVAEKAGIIKK